MNINVNGVWKNILETYVKITGSWKKVTKIYVKIAGVWKEVFSVPDNMIAFYDGVAPSNTLLCDGTNGTLNLIGKYLKIAATQGTLDKGSNSHGHVLSDATRTSVNNNGDGNKVIGTRANRTTFHTHAMGHTHATINSEPLYKNLAPVLPRGRLPVGAILFLDNSYSVPSGWTLVSSYDGRFIRGGTNGLTGGKATHTHNSSVDGILYTKYENAIEKSAKLNQACEVAQDSNHNHTMVHSHTSSNDPPFICYRTITNVNETTTIPNGVCAFFTGSTIPFGWTYLSADVGKFVKVNPAFTAAGGASTHTHSTSSAERSGSTAIADGDDMCDGNLLWVDEDGHTHAIAHTHAAQSNDPLHRELLFCRKG